MRRVKLFRKGRFVGIVDKDFHRQEEVMQRKQQREQQINQFWDELILPNILNSNSPRLTYFLKECTS